MVVSVKFSSNIINLTTSELRQKIFQNICKTLKNTIQCHKSHEIGRHFRPKTFQILVFLAIYFTKFDIKTLTENYPPRFLEAVGMELHQIVLTMTLD